MHKDSPASMCLKDWGNRGNSLAKFKKGEIVICTKDGIIHEILGVNPWVCNPSEIEYVLSDCDYLAWECELESANSE